MHTTGPRERPERPPELPLGRLQVFAQAAAIGLRRGELDLVPREAD